MRGNFKPARIRLMGLILLFLITASGVFAYSAAKSHQAKPVLSVETALKAIDFAAENDISIDSEFSANLRQSINFNRNRYYSPALGRFTSKDPIGFNGGFNLYRYVANNPALYTDPFGLIWVFAGWTQYLETNVDVNRDPTYRYLPRFEIMRVDYWQYIEHWIPEPPCFEQKKPQLGRAPRFQSFTPIGIRPFMGSTNYYSDKVPEKALYFKTDPVSSFRELPAPPPHN